MRSGIEREDIKVALGEAEAQNWCHLMKIRQNHVGGLRRQLLMWRTVGPRGKMWMEMSPKSRGGPK